MLVASNSHWLDTFYVTIMTKFQQIGNYTLKSTQSMWIACCKHYTLIGYFSFSITHIGKNFTHWLGTFQSIPWKVPNQCELLAASITHWLGTFHFQLQILVNILHIDWALFKLYLENYPIKVKCLRTPPVQAFHID